MKLLILMLSLVLGVAAHAGKFKITKPAITLKGELARLPVRHK